MSINEAIEILQADAEGDETPPDVWQEAVEVYNAAIYEGSPLADR